MTKFHAEFPNFMQNLETWIVQNIAVATKTVTGQYGSSTILQQVNDQSDQQCQFLGVIHTALRGVVEHWQLRGAVSKLGEC